MLVKAIMQAFAWLPGHFRLTFLPLSLPRRWLCFNATKKQHCCKENGKNTLLFSSQNLYFNENTFTWRSSSVDCAYSCWLAAALSKVTRLFALLKALHQFGFIFLKGFGELAGRFFGWVQKQRTCQQFILLKICQQAIHCSLWLAKVIVKRSAAGKHRTNSERPNHGRCHSKHNNGSERKPQLVPNGKVFDFLMHRNTPLRREISSLFLLS